MTTHAFSPRALPLPILAPLGELPFAWTGAVGPMLQLVALFHAYVALVTALHAMLRWLRLVRD